MFSTSRLLVILFAAVNFSSALPHPVTESSANPQWKQIGHLLRSRATTQEYVAYSVAGINQLQTWYSAATGLWDNLWWPSANVVTMMADFEEYFPHMVEPTTRLVYPTTLKMAPISSGFAGFLNGFYDDELWWALAWINVYDVTKDNQYLDVAAQIFEDSKSVWGQATCGGLWWDKAHTQNGAVTNELYITTAAKLANRRPATPSPGYYYQEAIKAYDWFIKSGLINKDNLINNGLNLQTCKNDGNPVFSYNQGIILSGLAELSWASGDSSYIDLANTLALAGIKELTDENGILHEKCEATGSCNADMEQFKGVFARNIQYLVNRAAIPAETRNTYKTFLQKNADSIWVHDGVSNQLGLVWSAPDSKATVQTQSSALDAIVGAACVS
ncbi:hypothetical protein HYFRA_00009562 [Hymenoscyphus fraxineus]|uniref:Glycoside hydrolase family 76 protein n=1 Tax=Hymenoscyphus fraxineus TaxID=746836 RepID=A0A9N9KZJ0_9HELO|nr:hypothetical protein HYFRA_00009562 [Hymenoscyphus fraxineus]